MNAFFRDKERPLVLGHRGVAREFQENTLPGFQRAVDLGLDGVELDVFATRDGRLAVFHDEDAERLTGTKGSISDMTWDEVSRLRINKRIALDKTGHVWHNYQESQRIPLLEEVLELLPDSMLVNIEMKANKPMWSRRHTGRFVADVIQRSHSEDRVITTSFDPFMLRDMEKFNSRLHSGFAYDDSMAEGLKTWFSAFPEWPGEISDATENNIHLSFLNKVLEWNLVGFLAGSTVVGVEHNLIDADTAQRFRERNMLLGAYTLFPIASDLLDPRICREQEAEALRLYQMQVDWIETDDPERLLNLLHS